jgi:cyclase
MPSVAVGLREELKDVGVRYVINTEHHPDHTFGNYYFQDADAVVAHKLLRERYMSAPGLDCYDKNLEETKANDPEGLEVFPEKEEYWAHCNYPTVEFDTELKLSVGKQEFVLTHTGGHCRDQICVHCPREGVIFCGDTVFYRVQIFFAEADPFHQLDALDFVESLDADTIVPGHGGVCGKQAVAETKGFILEWLGAVQTAIGKGWSREECMDRISFADRYPIDFGLDHVLHDLQRGNAGKLYDYLTTSGEGRGYDQFP